MKTDFHFHFYSRIIIMAVLAVSILLIQQSVRSTAQIISYPYEISGWAWNAQYNTSSDPIGFGWLSLNCRNDFEIPGVPSSTCSNVGGIDYALSVDTAGNVGGCAWAGNNASGGTDSPLGWVCFGDLYNTQNPVYGVTTSTNSTYINSLATTTFASILSQEDWRCSADSPRVGQRCPSDPLSTFCAPGGIGTCDFTDDDAWRLGFPIQDSADDDTDEAPFIGVPGDTVLKVCSIDRNSCISDSQCPASQTCIPSKSIDGCFNCYEKYNYGCSITNNDCILDVDCPSVSDGGDPPVFVPQTCSVVKSIDKNCENCLDYSYYPGRCEDSSGNVGSRDCGGDDNITDLDNCCVSDNDCSLALGETCKKINTCRFDTSISGINEYNCNATADSCVVGDCVEREIGSFRQVIGGYNCSECNIENERNVCGVNVYEGNLNSCGMCESTFYTPGVMLDHGYYEIDPPGGTDDPTINRETANLCGWGWNAWDDGSGNIDGLDWFQFGPRVVTTTKPYLSVERGNIYSQKSITGSYLPPFGRYNASYLIESGGSITNFVSSSTLSGDYQAEFSYRPIIAFPTLDTITNKYNNALGTIDYTGLIEDFSGNGLNINKYGATINTLASMTGVSGIYGGEVDYYTGPQTLGAPGGSTATFVVGIGTVGIPDASGVIVVDGNFAVNDNIEYSSGTYTNLQNIPSLVWVIRGDLIIGPEVENLAGTFIVLGNPGVTAYCDPDPLLRASGCGQVVTCASGDCSLALTITGNVIARYFDLGRTYSGLNVASESFINDGRLQANPPAGFEDFSNLIPRFTDG